MAKRGASGSLCLQSATLCVMTIMCLLVVYMIATSSAPRWSGGASSASAALPNMVVIAASSGGGGGGGVVGDMYAPPLTFEDPAFQSRDADRRGVPINIRTRGYGDSEYSQVGILTDAREGASSDVILPLFGRKSDRDKHQYYAVSNSGSLNTRLPVSLSGKSCAGEYGCDEISSGDLVFTSGYAGDFKATMYESGLNRYIPY